MADYDFTADELAAADRLPRYNERPFNADATSPAYNPWGFDNGGYLTLQMKQARDTMLMGVAARRFASSSSSSAILAAQEASNAKAERQAAQNAATDAYNSAGVAGTKVALAQAEADRARAERIAAQGYAAGLKMPVIDPSLIGRFVKVGVDGSGNAVYELGEITIASAAQIIAGTGKGVVNAETLGPILQPMRDALPPVGSYVLRPSHSAPLGSNFMEAKGQVVSIASYPAIADALPALYRQYLNANPVETEIYHQYDTVNGGGAGSLYWAVADETRAFISQQSAWTFQNFATGVFISGSGTMPGVQTTTVEAVFRTNDIVVLGGTYSGPVHIDITSQATISSGAQLGNAPSTAPQGYEKLFKLPNGALVTLAADTVSPNTYGIYRLRADRPRTEWAKFHPSTFAGASFGYQPRMWQTKNGTVYAAVRASQSDPLNIYRTTDGEAWTVCNQIAATAGWSIGPLKGQMTTKAYNFDSNFQFEGKGGEQIVVRIGQGRWLVSNNSGATYAALEWNVLNFGNDLNTQYRTANQMDAICFHWDTFGNRWLVGFLATKRNDPAGNLRVYAVVYQTTDLQSFNLLHEVYLGITNSSAPTRCVTFVTSTKIHVLGYLNASRGSMATINKADGTAAISDMPYLNLTTLENYPFDGAVIVAGSSARWISKDDKIDTGWMNKVRLMDAWVAGNVVAAIWNAGQFDQGGLARRFTYNPATERKLPTLTQTPIQDPYTTGRNIFEKYGDFSDNRALRWFIRVL